MSTTHLRTTARATVGILGGMGPAATVELYRKIVACTPAKRDQDHLPIILWADPTVPDRTDALLGRGPDPTPWLIRGAAQLAAMGASFVAVPCNTAHAFLPRVESEVRIPFINMVAETVRVIKDMRPAVQRVGLLATTGTIRSDLYQSALARNGIEAVLPSEDHQEHCVMKAIQCVKAGDTCPSTTQLMAYAAKCLVERKAELIILGCTELGLIDTAAYSLLTCVDAMQVLANTVVRKAYEGFDLDRT